MRHPSNYPTLLLQALAPEEPRKAPNPLAAADSHRSCDFRQVSGSGRGGKGRFSRGGRLLREPAARRRGGRKVVAAPRPGFPARPVSRQTVMRNGVQPGIAAPVVDLSLKTSSHPVEMLVAFARAEALHRNYDPEFLLQSAARTGNGRSRQLDTQMVDEPVGRF